MQHLAHSRCHHLVSLVGVMSVLPEGEKGERVRVGREQRKNVHDRDVERGDRAEHELPPRMDGSVSERAVGGKVHEVKGSSPRTYRSEGPGQTPPESSPEFLVTDPPIKFGEGPPATEVREPRDLTKVPQAAREADFFEHR